MEPFVKLGGDVGVIAMEDNAAVGLVVVEGKEAVVVDDVDEQAAINRIKEAINPIVR
jgi:CTP:molybdopterin cytidylyltransferase MocA